MFNKCGLHITIITLFALILSGAAGVSAAEWIELPLRNPGFEEPLVNETPPGWKRGWAWNRGATFQAYDYLSISTEFASEGSHSFKMDGTSAHGIEKVIVSEPLPAVAGAEYRVSVNIYAAPAKDPHPYMVLAFWGRSGTRIHLKTVRSSGLDGQWERFSVSEIAPEGTAEVYVALVGNSTYTGVTYWDDVTMEVRYPEGVTPPDHEGPGVPLSHWADPTRVGEVLAGTRTEADVTWWGFDPEDSTQYLQAAIDSGVPRLTIPNVGRDWIVRPIFLRSNLELILEDGVVVTAKKGEFRGRNDSLFSATDAENLIIRGYGATIRMQKEDYDNPELYDKAEWRMGLALRGVTNAQVLGLTIKDTGGDGIYLGRGGKIYNENVIIRDLIADNNYRQGISVISAKDLLIEDSVFRNTGGTAPMAGIDLEPNRPDERLENIVIRNSVFENNQGPGIHMYLAFMDSTSVPVSILWEDIIITGSTVGVNINYGGSDDFPEGEIVVRNCIVEGSERNGIGIRNKNDKGAMHIKIEDCILRDVATNPVNLDNLPNSVPIYLHGNSDVHNVTLKNVTVVDSHMRPVLYGQVREADGDEAGFYGINGSLKVLNPYGTEILWDGPVRDITMDVEEIDSFHIDYTRAAAHPEYDWDPVDVNLEPVIRIVNPSMVRPFSVVKGLFAPEIDFLHFGSDELDSVEVWLDGEPVYISSERPFLESLEIDTTTLHDGNHEFRVVAHGKTIGRIEQSTLLFTRNFELIVDRFEGPKELAWFGTVYSPIVIDQSGGWEYVTDQPIDFFGDVHRKRRHGNTTEYLVWKTPGLFDFTIQLYTREDLAPGVLVVEGSTDQEAWVPIAYTADRTDLSDAGWRKLVVRSDVDSPGTHQFVRLTLKQANTNQHIQLGEAMFRVLRAGDED